MDKAKVEEAKTPYGGHRFSDYVLLGKDGKPLAVVEAKKTAPDTSVGIITNNQLLTSGE